MRIVSCWTVSLLLASASVTADPTASDSVSDAAEAAAAAAAAPISARSHRIEGQLLERGTRTPLSSVNVFILPHKLKATTDDKGNFVFENVPEGAFNWVVNLTGYNRLEREDPFGSTDEGARSSRTLYLERSSYQTYETVIYGKRNQRDVQTKTLRQEQFLTTPGSGGDPVKAIQNSPGINRGFGLSSQVVIQGAVPQDTRYTVDGHDVPLIFHFGGLTSVLFPESIDRVDYLAAGYGPEYGRANGGVISLWTRSPRQDRFHGIGYVDIFNSGLLLEGPASHDENGKPSSGFLFSVRKSYIGEVLRAAFKNNDDFDLTVAPSFSDIAGIYETELTPIDSFKLSTNASLDKLEFLLKQPVETDPEFRGEFESKTAFFRVIPQLTHRHSSSTTSRWSLGLGRDWIRFLNAENHFFLQTYQATARGEVEHHFSPLWTTYVGMDHNFTRANVQIDVPDFNSRGGIGTPLSVSERRRQEVTNTSSAVGLYTRNEVKTSSDSPLTLLPNLRFDYFSETKEALWGPRPGARYALSDTLTLRGATGIYYQPPQPEQTDPVFGNPSVKSPRAVHATFGFEKDFRGTSENGWNVSADGFYKYLDQLVVNSSATRVENGALVRENFNNSGKGRVYGAQTQVRLDANPWALVVNYTVSKSERWQPGQGIYPSRYDQTHLIGVLGSVNLPRNWRIGSRFRYSTGNPATPVVGGTFDADNDVYVPERGAFYSRRLNPFMQLDVRIDKRWPFERWILSAYLDIQNLTNRKNPEQVSYNYDFTQSTTVSGLPVLPTFGLKGEF